MTAHVRWSIDTLASTTHRLRMTTAIDLHQSITDSPSSFEGALLDARRAIASATGFLVNDSDLRAVRAALEHGAPVPIPPREIENVVNAWLDAAIVLRTSDLPRTTATLAGLVAGGRGFPAAHARRLIALLAREPDNDVQFARNAIEHEIIGPTKVRSRKGSRRVR